MLDDLTGDCDLGQLGRVGGQVGSVDHENGSKRDSSAGLTLDLLDLDEVTNSDLVLLSAGLDDRVRCHRRATPPCFFELARAAA